MRRTDQLPPGPTGLAEQIVALRRQVRELTAARSVPYLPWSFAPARSSDWPATTATDMETIWQATVTRVQPSGQVTVGAVADAGTTGQIQITLNDQALAPVDIGEQQSDTTFWFDLPGDSRDQVVVCVQACRTAGAGSVRCQVTAAAGLQTT